jgi:hypothetical protein
MACFGFFAWKKKDHKAKGFFLHEAKVFYLVFLWYIFFNTSSSKKRKALAKQIINC